MSAWAAVTATRRVSAGALRFYERTNYEYNNREKNNTYYNGSHNLMTPINMDCQPLRARNDKSVLVIAFAILVIASVAKQSI